MTRKQNVKSKLEEQRERTDKIIESHETHEFDLRSECTKRSEIYFPVKVTHHDDYVHIHASIAMKNDTYQKMRHLAALNEQRLDEYMRSSLEEMVQAHLSNPLELGQLIAKRINEEVYGLSAAAPEVKIRALKERGIN